MISKTVLLFPTKVPDGVVALMEEILNDRDDGLIHIESVTSHSIRLLSFQQQSNTAINEVLGFFFSKSNYVTTSGLAFSERQHATYVKLALKGSSQLTQAGIDQVRTLF